MEKGKNDDGDDLMFWICAIVIIGVTGCAIGKFSLTMSSKGREEKWSTMRRPILCNKINCTKSCKGWNVCENKW